MAWKEYKELLSGYGNVRRNLYSLLLFTVLLGLYFPWVAGPDFVRTPAVLLLYIWFPLCMMLSVMIDSFAGERDRHTLETLLASRLPDSAIVLGKILPVVIYGIGVTVASLLSVWPSWTSYTGTGIYRSLSRILCYWCSSWR